MSSEIDVESEPKEYAPPTVAEHPILARNWLLDSFIKLEAANEFIQVYKRDEREENANLINLASKTTLLFHDVDLENEYVHKMYFNKLSRLQRFFIASNFLGATGASYWLYYGLTNPSFRFSSIMFSGFTYAFYLPFTILIFYIPRHWPGLIGFWLPLFGLIINIGSVDILFLMGIWVNVPLYENGVRSFAAILYVFLLMLIELLTRKPFWTSIISNVTNVVFYTAVIYGWSARGPKPTTDSSWSPASATWSNLIFIGSVVPLGFAILSIYFSYIHDDHLRQRFISEKFVREQAVVYRTANDLKSKFLADMSHEIRNPLNIIMGYTQILIEDAQSNLNNACPSSSPASSIDMMTQILDTSQQLRRLVDDLLDISKLEAKKMVLVQEKCFVSTLVDECIESMSMEALQRGLCISCYVACIEQNDHVLADAVRVKQVITNFISNSLKFTKQGVNKQGEIAVIVLIDNDKDKKETDTHVPLTFRIVDTGQGIKPEDKVKLFNRFYSQPGVQTTQQDRVKSNGIGLTVCRDLVTLMGGTIGAESDGLGKGSVFWFSVTFPKAPGNTEANTTHEPPKSPAAPTQQGVKRSLRLPFIRTTAIQENDESSNTDDHYEMSAAPGSSMSPKHFNPSRPSVLAFHRASFSTENRLYFGEAWHSNPPQFARDMFVNKNIGISRFGYNRLSSHIHNSYSASFIQRAQRLAKVSGQLNRCICVIVEPNRYAGLCFAAQVKEAGADCVVFDNHAAAFNFISARVANSILGSDSKIVLFVHKNTVDPAATNSEGVMTGEAKIEKNKASEELVQNIMQDEQLCLAVRFVSLCIRRITRAANAQYHLPVSSDTLLIPVKREELYDLLNHVSDENQPDNITQFEVEEDTRISTAISDAAPTPTESTLKNIRVLVAEDNELNKKIIEKFLTSAGATIVSASTGLEALNHFKNKPFDVALMDIRMPEMNGFEVTREIREYERIHSQHELRIIATTGSVHASENQTALEAGMNFICPKPLIKSKLIQAVYTEAQLTISERERLEKEAKEAKEAA